MERKGALGVDGRLNAVIFETTRGEWVSSARIDCSVTPESRSRPGFRLLDGAIVRG